jgi:hypothetical protein
VRNSLEESLCSLNFASKLCGLFKVLITGALSDIIGLNEDDKHKIIDSIDQTVVNFFTQVMQMDSFALRQETLE